MIKPAYKVSVPLPKAVYDNTPWYELSYTLDNKFPEKAWRLTESNDVEIYTASKKEAIATEHALIDVLNNLEQSYSEN